MKHLITFLTLVLTTLLPLSSMAAPVSPEKAREKAIKLFSSRMQTRAVPEFELIWDGETAATRSTQDAALYIFDRTDGPGFIIIAGDDAVPTVLGYSFEHNFGRGTMPENLHYWLSCQRQIVLAARQAAGGSVHSGHRPHHCRPARAGCYAGTARDGRLGSVRALQPPDAPLWWPADPDRLRGYGRRHCLQIQPVARYG